MRLLLLILLSSICYGQDADFIQAKIDSAIKVNGVVMLESKTYFIEKPLVIADYNNEYKQVSIEVIGTSRMWDNNKGTIFLATFKDAPLLSIQLAKNVIIRGINFQGQYNAPKESPYTTPLQSYGDTSCRDSQFSPYCGIAIDPFSHTVPKDGGYPTLRSYYRGYARRGGSTGVRIEDCTFNKFTIGVMISPNGYTQNAELITLQNIRVGTCKIGIAGGQAQEKMNRIINVGAWEVCHTLFVFNLYGQGTPGHYVIDGVNIAGSVANLVYRNSGGYFPLIINNVFAESIGAIGYWNTNVNDALNNSSFNFRYKEDFGFPNYHMEGGGVLLSNNNFRYYGKNDPVVFYGDYRLQNNIAPNLISGKRMYDGETTQQQVTIAGGQAKIKGCYAPGRGIVFGHIGNWEYRGIGSVIQSDCDSTMIGFISPKLINGRYTIYVLK